MPNTLRDASNTTPMIARPDCQAILRILKETHGMSQRDVAEAIGKSKSTIADIATGKIEQPRADILHALEKLLEKSAKK